MFYINPLMQMPDKGEFTQHPQCAFLYVFYVRKTHMLFSTAEMEIGRVDRPVGLRFIDRPVKPVETPVKFSFLATKRHLSPNRNMHTYFIINKASCKKMILTNHTF